MAGSDLVFFFCFFFNDTATTEIYTLSLHDALPILTAAGRRLLHLHARLQPLHRLRPGPGGDRSRDQDRKSTRLNSSHGYISYAVFCLKKKNIIKTLYSHKKIRKLKKKQI